MKEKIKDLIDDDTCRCGNDTCDIRLKCARFLQLSIDIKNGNEYYYMTCFDKNNCNIFIETPKL